MAKFIWYDEIISPRLTRKTALTVNDTPSTPPPQMPGSKPPTGPLRSPIRPQHPDAAPPQNQSGAGQASAPKTDTSRSNPLPKTPRGVLEILRKKMEAVAGEYGSGKINRTQFNAIYGRYDEQKKIIERIIERNPESSAWQQVMGSGGPTGFLREHFQAHCLYYLVYRLNWPRPLMMGGQQQPQMEHIEPVLMALHKMQGRLNSGVARKSLDNGHWLVLALGERAVTLAMFNLEPSTIQVYRVRDLHNDFERANRSALDRGTRTLEKMVFPQRALVEQS